jgi:AcrR family transcriptional regulator
MTTSGRGTPRERARSQLTAEIKDVARRQLAQVGAGSLSMRSIARELGLGSASALYRYFPSREAILTALIIDAYDSLGAAAEAAEARVHGQAVINRWMAICHGVRGWALEHPQEYALIFGTPVPGYAAPADTIGPATRIPSLLTAQLADLVAAGDDAQGELEPASRAVHRALRPVRAITPPAVSDELIARGLMAWTYLFGAISFEVFGHRREIVSGPAPFFDHEMRTIAAVLGIAGRPA